MKRFFAAVAVVVLAACTSPTDLVPDHDPDSGSVVAHDPDSGS